MTPYFNDNDNFMLYEGECNSVMDSLTEQVDMIFADPPYFLSNQKKTTAFGKQKIRDKGEWDRVLPWKEINAFNKTWLTRCRNLLKENGTIWVCGTYHNIYSVEQCLIESGFKILNIVVWQKLDPPPTPYGGRLNFSAEYIVWARKNDNVTHCFNYDLLKQLNGGVEMPDVWKFARPGFWERSCGKHPTQKPLRLLYRIIQTCTKEGFTVLDPFAGSCTTGIAANLMGRRFIGIDMNKDYLDYGIRRKIEILDPVKADKILSKMSENPEEVTVMVNHVNLDLRKKMIDTGICYLRAGDSKGSLCVTPGFERVQYVLLHTNGEDCQLFRLKNKGTFQIWTKETLEKYGFTPSHSPYYIVLHFDSKNVTHLGSQKHLKEGTNTFRAKIRRLSDFIGIN
ncbi:MAG: site-specific DNA-methyltransferase [Bacteroides sp.]|nr:site-specific DNA-methyltransferase [Bacteroides sp.]